MSLLTKLFLAVPVICIILLILLIIANIFNVLTRNSIKKHFYIKYRTSVILSLIVLFIISIPISISIAIEDVFSETILKETSPNKKFYLEIESETGFITVYVKDNTSQNSRLEKLLDYSISQDLGTLISSGNTKLTWDNNVAKLEIWGEVEILYLDIWLDEKTNEFKYKLDPVNISSLGYTQLLETSPNNRVDIEIKSSSGFDFGTGIIIYVKDNKIKNSDLEELLRYSISKDQEMIYSKDIQLSWFGDMPSLVIHGDKEILYISIWMDYETNKFRYELNPYKKEE